MDKLKKPLIFGLMGVVFLGCMLLIFKPSTDKKKIEDTLRLNDAVHKQRVRRCRQEKTYNWKCWNAKDGGRNALTTLSDYWNTDSSADNEMKYRR
jgi:hypothetical protein